MHLLLTDRLTCPRCGPEFGLILLADTVEERRVLEGALGCANCREQYRVEAGFADLRPPPHRSLPDETVQEEADYWESLRLAALLGIEQGPGFALMHGPAARAAPRVAGMIEDLEVVALWGGAGGWEEAPGVSRMAASVPLPFYSMTLRGALLSSVPEAGAEETEESRGLVEEAVRVVQPGGRVVVLESPEDTRERLEGSGCRVLLEEEGVTVAEVGRG